MKGGKETDPKSREEAGWDRGAREGLDLRFMRQNGQNGHGS